MFQKLTRRSQSTGRRPLLVEALERPERAEGLNPPERPAVAFREGLWQPLRRVRTVLDDLGYVRQLAPFPGFGRAW